MENSNALATKPAHVGLADKMSVRDFHFTLQQIRLIGNAAGLSRASFSLPLNILTREELEERLRRIRDAQDRALKALAQQSFAIGQKIVVADELVDKKLVVLGASLDTLARAKRKRKNKNIGGEEEKNLKEKIAALKDYKSELRDADTQRVNSTETEELDDVETRLDRLVEKIKNIPHPRDILRAVVQKTRDLFGFNGRTPPP